MYRIKWHNLFFLLIAFLFFSAGYPYAQRGDLSAMIANLKELAEKGDASALYHLSTLYEHGYDSVPADSLLSRKYLYQSAEKGYPAAMNYHGYLLYADSPTENRDTAIYWLEKAAEAGDFKAMNNLAYVLLDGSAGDDEVKRGIELLTAASVAGVPAATDRLADLYRLGKGVVTDTVMARKLYLEAISKGAPDSEKKLLSLLLLEFEKMSAEEALQEGIIMSEAGARRAAFILFNKAVENDNPKAHTLLADAYAGAKGTDYNNKKAMEHYVKGASGGDPSAQFILAELLEIFPDILSEYSDLTLNPEMSSPTWWYEKAARQNVTDAATAIERLFKSE